MMFIKYDEKERSENTDRKEGTNKMDRKCNISINTGASGK